MRNETILPIAFGLVTAGSLFDLMQLPLRGAAWANLTVLLLLAGAGLAFGGIALNWRFYQDLPRGAGRVWLRREFGFILLAEIVLLYSLASRTGNARFTVVPALLSCLGLVGLALAVLCRLRRQRMLERPVIESVTRDET